ncbi:nucleoside-triphosphatase [Chloroflexota bacterium]
MFIITGDTAIGKSTICEELKELARLEGLTYGGIITCKSSDGGIIIKELQSEMTEILASVDDKYNGPRIGKYYFNPVGIQFGLEAIKNAINTDMLFVDELGYLELKGDGFSSIMKLLTSGKVRNSIVVIRKELLAELLPLLGSNLTIFEATISNRNQLPMAIFSHITSKRRDKTIDTYSPKNV